MILGNRKKELEGAKVIPIVPELVAEVLSPSENTRMIHRRLKSALLPGFSLPLEDLFA